jgi:dolichol kinase
LAYTFIQVVSICASKKIMTPHLARKVIHTLSSPLYMLLWPLFSTVPAARFFAALVTGVNMFRLARAAKTSIDGHETDDRILAMAISRSGDANEAVGGPLIYVSAVTLLLLIGGPHSSVVVTALSNLAAGDGLSNIVGRRYGTNNQWPGLKGKSVMGTLAFLIGASLCSIVLLSWNGGGASTIPGTNVLLNPSLPPLWRQQIVKIAAFSALVELIPGIDDNFTVPTASGLLAWYLLRN